MGVHLHCKDAVDLSCLKKRLTCSLRTQIACTTVPEKKETFRFAKRDSVGLTTAVLAQKQLLGRLPIVVSVPQTGQ